MCTMCQPRKKNRFLVGIQLCTLTKKTWVWKLESMCTMCQPRKKQVPGWNPIVYINEKNMDLEVGIDVYDVPAPKKIRFLVGIQLCTLTKKNMDLEVGIDVYDVPAPKQIRFLVGIQLCALTKKTWVWKLESMCTMCQPRKKQVPGWNPIVYINEKNMDLEVGSDVYDVPAPKKIRFLVGIQLCTLRKKTWMWKLESMCTMCQPRKKKQVPGWDPIVYLNEKNMDSEVGIDVYDVPAPKKNRFLVGIQLCTLTKKTWIWKLESMGTMCRWNRCVRCASPEKKTGSWLGSNCVP